MVDKIVQLVDKDNNNIYPLSRGVAADSIDTAAIQNGAVTAQKIDSATLAYSYNSWEVVKQYVKADLTATGNTNTIDSVDGLVLSRLKGTNIYKISSKQVRLSSVTSGARGGVSFTTGLTLANSVSDNVGITWNYNDNSAAGCETLQMSINASGVCELSTYYNSNSTNMRYWQFKDFIFEISA